MLSLQYGNVILKLFVINIMLKGINLCSNKKTYFLKRKLLRFLEFNNRRYFTLL